MSTDDLTQAAERTARIIADHCFGPHATKAAEDRALDIAGACVDDMADEGLLAAPAPAVDRATLAEVLQEVLDEHSTTIVSEVDDSIEFDTGYAATVLADRLITQPRPGARACDPEDTWFDRSICPEPCGTMHTRCVDCGRPVDGCPHDQAAPSEEDQR
jgi:hypothetical protein